MLLNDRILRGIHFHFFLVCTIESVNKYPRNKEKCSIEMLCVCLYMPLAGVVSNSAPAVWYSFSSHIHSFSRVPHIGVSVSVSIRMRGRNFVGSAVAKLSDGRLRNHRSILCRGKIFFYIRCKQCNETLPTARHTLRLIHTRLTKLQHQHTDCIYGHHTDWLRKNCNDKIILAILL